MATPKVYVICDQNCKFEGITKDQIITAITNAVNSGDIGDIDAGFITKIKETNANKTMQFWVGTSAQFIALKTKDENTFYILTDDDSAASWDQIAEDLQGVIAGVEKIIIGETVVEKARHAENATSADNATNATNASKVNNLEIKKDSNGNLKIGDIIISQKRLLDDSTKTITSGVNFEWSVKATAPTEPYEIYTSKGIFKIRGDGYFCVGSNGNKANQFLSIIVKSSGISFDYKHYSDDGAILNDKTMNVYRIYHVTE